NTNEIKQIARQENSGEFTSMISSDSVLQGDIVQLYGNFGGGLQPHTMIIAKKEAEGIWVFDTNFGTLSEYVEYHGGAFTKNADGMFEFVGEGNGNYKYQSDNTIRYRFISYDDWN